jgi:hypothetical protein
MEHEIKMYAGPSFEKMARRLADLGLPQTNPLLSVGFGIEDEAGAIVASVVVHSVPIVDSLKIDKEWRGNQARSALMEAAREFIERSEVKHVLMHTANETMEKILKAEPYNCTEVKEKFLEWNRR